MVAISEPTSAPPTKSIRIPESFPANEIDISWLVLKEHGHNIRWCPEEQLFYVWNDSYWQAEVDARGKVFGWTKKTIISLLIKAAKLKDDSLRTLAAKFAAKVQTAATVKNVVDLIKNEVVLSMENMDADPWLLNVKNGTLNLRTGKLQEPKRDDYITGVAPVTYDRRAKCPAWLDFVAWTCQDSGEFVAFKQRLFGSCLTGVVRDQKVIIDYGESGSNGKSTLYGTLQTLLGSHYAVSMEPASVMDSTKRNGAAASPDIMKLRGARLAVMGEGEDGQHFAEGLLKLLSGGDRIPARPLYGKATEFMPTHKLVMFTNHKPVIKDMGHSIWRRVKQIPSLANIDEDEKAGTRKKDIDLPAKLQAELSGILNWLIAGCVAWQKSGLGSCKEVDEATEAYRSEMDLIGAFLEEYVSGIEDFSHITVKETYAAYKQWCDETGRGRTTLSQQRFDGHLKTKKNCTVRVGHANVRYWDGLDAVKGPPAPATITTLYTEPTVTETVILDATEPQEIIPCFKCAYPLNNTHIKTVASYGTGRHASTRIAECPECHCAFNPDAIMRRVK